MGLNITALCKKRSVMVYNKYTKLCILQLRQKGLHPPAIERYLWKEEGIRVTSRGVAKFIKQVQKRLEFAREHQSDNFANVVFTDECSVQLETHRRRCCRKIGEPSKNKPRLVSFHHKLSDDIRRYFP